MSDDLQRENPELVAALKDEIKRVKEVRDKANLQLLAIERLLGEYDKSYQRERPYEGWSAIRAAIAYIKTYGAAPLDQLKQDLLALGACSDKAWPHRSIGQGIQAALDPPKKKSSKTAPKASLVIRDGKVDLNRG